VSLSGPVLYRSGGLCGAAGALLTGVLALLHPTRNWPGDPHAFLEMVAAATTWVPLHAGLIVGVGVMLPAFAALTISLRDTAGHALARLGLLIGALAIVLWGLVFGGEVGVKYLMDAGAEPAALAMAGHLRDAIETLFGVTIALSGLGTLLFGLAMVVTDRYPARAGSSAVLLGTALALLVGLPRILYGRGVVWWAIDIVDEIVFPLLMALTLLWILVLAVLLYREAEFLEQLPLSRTLEGNASEVP
jgi:hypothetical protein